MAKNKLAIYKKKRDLTKTPEPGINQRRKKASHTFVIQLHKARRLHYDFRLEIDGVLVSWAIPKGFSTIHNEKHLAIRTEDHPLAYANFEGVIPKGQYGGGTVLIWDKGKYKPFMDEKRYIMPMKRALDQGALKFTLNGKKLKGSFAMVRTSKGSSKEQWILFKLRDEFSNDRRNTLNVKSNSFSVKSGRSLKEITDDETHERSRS